MHNLGMNHLWFRGELVCMLIVVLLLDLDGLKDYLIMFRVVQYKNECVVQSGCLARHDY
jgi:hypothetical protein